MHGRATLGAEERQWRFIPEQPCSEVAVLKVDTALDDLAGNKVGRPFEVDLFDHATRRVEREVLSVPVRVTVR